METALFSQSLIKGLTDKIYDRRKGAALEIERLVRENENSKERITEIVDTLVQNFVYSNNPYARYGGLIGLAATSIALGPNVIHYLDIIVPPILSCFSHQDQKMRYYACESMYNIAKVAKGEVLKYFNSIFDSLCKLSADSEVSVKNGAELLDRLIKDIVSELSTIYVSPLDEPFNTIEPGGDVLVTPNSLPRNTAFSLPRFIPLLSQRIYVRNSAARQFLVSWISVLDSIPDLELVSFLPEFLDGLFLCLDDASDDVRVATSGLLADFLMEIKEAALVQQSEFQRYLKERNKSREILEQQQQKPNVAEEAKTEEDKEKIGENINSETESDQVEEEEEEGTTAKENEIELDSENDGHGKGTYVPGQGVIVQYGKIVEILVPHLSSPQEEIQLTALSWLNAFIGIAKDVIIQFTPEIIKAVLPCLAHSVGGIKQIAQETNQNLQKLVLETSIQNLDMPEPATSISDPLGNPALQQKIKSATARRSLYVNDKKSMTSSTFDKDEPFDYQTTVGNLRLQFLNQHEDTRIASLDWLLMLHKKAPNKILASDDGTFPALLKTLSDSSEEVVRRDLQLLAQISSYSDRDYFRSFIMSLLSLFSTDRRLLESRGSLIIRQLCLSLDPERIYCAIADILETDEDLEFASIMVQNLNIILITAIELSDLRKRLRNLDNKENHRLFNVLYKSWCHNAVSAFSLCLLSQVYEHAANMLQVFAELEITVNMLIQIDKLVQLLESPVFTYLRLQLLEPEKYPYLFKCLYGILMLLPQSSAFSTLRNRLSSVSSLGFLHVLPKTQVTATNSSSSSSGMEKRQTTKAPSKSTEDNTIKFNELLQHFKSVQSRHEKQRRIALQNISRANTNRFRRSRIGNGDNTNGSGAYSGEENKGLGISAIGNGGIRNAMTGMNLGNSNPENDRSSNHTRTSSSPGSVSRMMGRRANNRRI
ncbi:ARM repeat-containing protein [Backusella circina FSU 941]|nr:ARM repeat-containing protein [Backusella circina FSU 941]